ncbi:MAG TPA: sulfatase-like hydrolase/transferase [Pirellulales bacterium]|nr:sulfatase-like hydrolase/transferase [Pirellulales bacterium]
MTSTSGAILTLLTGLATSVTLARATVSAAEPATKPNIVLILADDLGRGDFSAFGTPDIRTPHVDRLFREGVACENFFANSCVCSPTRAALLTGCYPDRVGVPGVIRDLPADSWGYLAEKATLLPKLLRAAGYHTAIVGKWHLGYEPPNRPNDRGFDLFHGFLGDMMDDYYTHRRHDQNFMRRNTETIDPPGHATDLFSQWACDYLTEHAAAGAKRPFFLYLAYNAPHGPIQPPQEWLDRVRRREPQMSDKRARLVALIEHLDSGVGRVLDKLDETQLADNTLVVFTSDNGGVVGDEANNGPWRSGKTHMYEGGLRVPCAVRWPGRISPSTKTEQIALSMDLFPTLLEAAGVTPPEDIDGRSVLPQLLGQTAVGTAAGDPREVYFVRREGGDQYCGKTIESLRRGDWKLVHDSPFAPPELYNLAEDPHEATNLAAEERKVLSELSAALRLHVQRGGQTPWQPAE